MAAETHVPIAIQEVEPLSVQPVHVLPKWPYVLWPVLQLALPISIQMGATAKPAQIIAFIVSAVLITIA